MRRLLPHILSDQGYKLLHKRPLAPGASTPGVLRRICCILRVACIRLARKCVSRVYFGLAVCTCMLFVHQCDHNGRDKVLLASDYYHTLKKDFVLMKAKLLTDCASSESRKTSILTLR